MLELIGAHLAWNLEANGLAKEQWLGGRPVKIVDGTCLSMPDTPENQARWPQSSTQAPGLGFPLLKLAGLFSQGSGAKQIEQKPIMLSTDDVSVGSSIGAWTMFEPSGATIALKVENTTTIEVRLAIYTKEKM